MRPTKITEKMLNEFIASPKAMNASEWGRKFELHHTTILRLARMLRAKGHEIEFNKKSPSERLLDKLD